MKFKGGKCKFQIYFHKNNLQFWIFKEKTFHVEFWFPKVESIKENANIYQEIGELNLWNATDIHLAFPSVQI